MYQEDGGTGLSLRTYTGGQLLHLKITPTLTCCFTDGVAGAIWLAFGRFVEEPVSFESKASGRSFLGVVILHFSGTRIQEYLGITALPTCEQNAFRRALISVMLDHISL